MPMPDRPPLSPRDVWGAPLEAALDWVEEVAENASAATDGALASFVEDPASQTRAAIEAIAGGGGAPLVPDPANDGFYVIPSGSTLTPDPDHSGFYKIGA